MFLYLGNSLDMPLQNTILNFQASIIDKYCLPYIYNVCSTPLLTRTISFFRYGCKIILSFTKEYITSNILAVISEYLQKSICLTY